MANKFLVKTGIAFETDSLASQKATVGNTEVQLYVPNYKGDFDNVLTLTAKEADALIKALTAAVETARVNLSSLLSEQI